MGELGQTVELGRDADLATGPAAAAPPRRSIWPAVHPPLLDRILDHRSTLVFVNARRMAERLAASLNELYAQRLHEQQLREQGLTVEVHDPAPAAASAPEGVR
jgi:ATP-dependent Lhr-like helicase